VLEILEGGEKVEICNTGGIPAGLQVDPDNVIWIADMKRGILKTTREGELAAVVETYTKSLWAYDVSEPGTAKNKRLFTKIPGDAFGHRLRCDDLIEEEFEIKDGAIKLPEGPGLGITLDKKAMAKYAKQTWESEG